MTTGLLIQFVDEFVRSGIRSSAVAGRTKDMISGEFMETEQNDNRNIKKQLLAAIT